MVARVVWGFMPTGTGFGARLVAAGVPIVAGAAAYYVAGISVRSPDIAGVTPSAWLDRVRKRP